MSLVKDLEVSHTGFRMVLNSVTDVLIRRGERDAQRRPGEGERGKGGFSPTALQREHGLLTP